MALKGGWLVEVFLVFVGFLAGFVVGLGAAAWHRDRGVP
jgi:hypothetical protein